MTNCSFVDVEDKVRSGGDEGSGDGCLDLGPVLPQRPTAKTCMYEYDLFFTVVGAYAWSVVILFCHCGDLSTSTIVSC